MSTDHRLPVIEYHGQTPCIAPHILGRLLDKLEVVRLRLKSKATGQPSWECIDRLAEAMEAAR